MRIGRMRRLQLCLAGATAVATVALGVAPAAAPALRTRTIRASGTGWLERLTPPAGAHKASASCSGQPPTDSISFYLSAPTSGSSGETLQTVAVGYPYLLHLTGEQCWSFYGDTLVGNYGDVDINGVWLVPVSGNPELLVAPADGDSDANGTVIYATGQQTSYYLEVPADSTDDTNTLGSGPIHNGPIPEASSPLDIVGEVNLGFDEGAPWVFNSVSSLIGNFSAVSGSPSPPSGGQVITSYGGQSITGGTVSDAGLSIDGFATVSVNVPLPRAFSTGPSSGPAPTAVFNYYTVDTNADFPGGAGGGGGSQSQGGGGGNLPPPTPVQLLCESAQFSQEHSYCNQAKYLQWKRLPAARTGRRSRHASTAARRAAPTAHVAGNALPGPLTFSTPDVYLGGLQISNVTFTYDPTEDSGCGGLWSGVGTLQIGDYGLDAQPDPPYGVNVCANGQVESGGAELNAGTEGVEIVPPILSITALGGSLYGGPTRLDGNVTASIFNGLIHVPGCFTVVFANKNSPYHYSPGDLSEPPPAGQPACHAPSQLQYSGPIDSFAAGIAGTLNLTVPVLGSIALGSGYGFYIYPSYFEFGGSFTQSLVIFTINGNVLGALDTSSGKYNLAGNISVCLPDNIGCGSLSGIVSSNGIGACGDVSIGPITAGAWFTYQWGASLPSFGFGCNDGSIQVDVSASSAAGTTNPTTIQIPSNDPVTSVTVTSRKDAPLLEVTGPGGQTASNTAADQAVNTDGITIVPFASGHETVIGLDHPAAGTWTITPLANSTPVTGVTYRNGLARPKVTATVTGEGRALTLHYVIRRRPHQIVTFAEKGPQLFHILGVARASHGTLGFTPALSPDRKREILATVQLQGLPDQNLVAGTYTAPPNPRAAVPGHVRLTHSKGGLTVSWTAGQNAASYLVSLKLSDGRKLLYTAGSGNGTVTIPHVSPGLSADATVVGIGPDGSLGSAADGQLSPTGVPAKVMGLRTATGPHGLVMRWNKVSGAVAYLVHVVLTGGADGQFIALTKTAHLQPSRALAALRRGDDATISIRALSSAGLLGPRDVLQYAPA
jgi:hypothetical protein